MENRAGKFVSTNSSYKAFVPNPLPPEPSIQMDAEMYELLSSADRKLGRLDGITEILPNPDLFVAMYVKKEAVLSSQIEGTQASLVDVLDVDANIDDIEKTNNIAEVVNYVDAMNYGIKRLKDLPLSLRLIKEIHTVLLDNVRGANRNPGEFRHSQNWIGPAGCSLQNATFVPPTVPDMLTALSDLELFLHDESHFIPPLIKIALIHAQFETIHPFLDGNGRMGRLLITFWLCSQGILHYPLLYLSYYFKANRSEYYDRLMDVRKKGAWEQWIKFFLKGVAEVADESTESAKQILSLKNECIQVLNTISSNKGLHQKVLDFLFDNPIITRKLLSDKLEISSPTAGTLIQDMCNANILLDMNPERARNKKYIFGAYMAILSKGTDIN